MWFDDSVSERNEYMSKIGDHTKRTCACLFCIRGYRKTKCNWQTTVVPSCNILGWPITWTHQYLLHTSSTSSCLIKVGLLGLLILLHQYSPYNKSSCLTNCIIQSTTFIYDAVIQFILQKTFEEVKQDITSSTSSTSTITISTSSECLLLMLSWPCRIGKAAAVEIGSSLSYSFTPCHCKEERGSKFS